MRSESGPKGIHYLKSTGCRGTSTSLTVRYLPRMDIDMLHLSPDWESASTSRFVERLRAARTGVLVCFSAFLLITGIPGNLITIIVLRRRSMKDNVISFYLTSLCAFHLVALCLRIPRLLFESVVEDDLINVNSFFCSLMVWLDFTVLGVITWIVVAVTGFKMFFIMKGSKQKSSTKPHIIVIIFLCFMCGVYIALILYNGIVFESVDGHFIKCSVKSQPKIVWFELLFYVLVPVALILFFNLMLFVFSLRTELTQSEGAHVSCTGARKNLAVLVSLSNYQLLLTTIPMQIILIYRHRIFDTDSQMARAKSDLGITIVLMFLYMNNSTNFLIFCIFGKKFRKQLKFIIAPIFEPCCYRSLERRRKLRVVRSMLKAQGTSLSSQNFISPSSGKYHVKTNTSLRTIPNMRPANRISVGKLKRKNTIH